MSDSSELFVLFKQYPSGGTVWLMLGLDATGSDYDDILAIADCMAKAGHEVKVLHAVHYKDPVYHEVFGELIGTRYYRNVQTFLLMVNLLNMSHIQLLNRRMHSETCCITDSRNRTVSYSANAI